jgi:hypothetical protein
MAINNKLKAFVRYANGKVVAGSMVMQAKKPAVGKWEEVAMYKCCAAPSGPFNLQQFLSRMNSCYTQVNSLIPNIFYFSDYNGDSGKPTYIDDGCNDMYDVGNQYNTNLTQLYVDIKEDNVDSALSIPYTHTQQNPEDCPYVTPPMNGFIADGTNYFGAGSQYFTNMYPGIFIIAANNINVTEFSITGNLGSDGEATDAVYIETAHPGWTAFIKTNDDSAGTGDASVNHIILVYGNVSGATQLYDDTGAYDDHCVQGLGPQNSTIITAIVATNNTYLDPVPPLTKEQALSIANKILDVYNDATCVTPPAFRLLFDDIANANTLVGDASNVEDWNTLFDLPTNGNPFTSVVISGNEVQLFGGSDITVVDGYDNDEDISINFGENQHLIEINDDAGCITAIGYSSFWACYNLTTARFKVVITAEGYAFQDDYSLVTVDFSSLESAGEGCFDAYDFNGAAFVNPSFPVLTFAGNQCFRSCNNLNNPSFPLLEYIGNSCFSSCSNLTTLNLPNVTTIGSSAFQGSSSLNSVLIPSCTNLGGTVGNNNVFRFITGNTITLTVPSALMTCNAGSPDGDIVYLQANNTVTVITV